MELWSDRIGQKWEGHVKTLLYVIYCTFHNKISSYKKNESVVTSFGYQNLSSQRSTDLSTALLGNDYIKIQGPRNQDPKNTKIPIQRFEVKNTKIGSRIQDSKLKALK